MYNACRHIKPSGARCRSRALRDGDFCYFHASFHNPHADGERNRLRLPVPEELAAIPISVARINDAIINEQIDTSQSAQLFRGLKLAYQAILARDSLLRNSVDDVTKSRRGDDLAPELLLCAPGDLSESSDENEIAAKSETVAGCSGPLALGDPGSLSAQSSASSSAPDVGGGSVASENVSIKEPRIPVESVRSSKNEALARAVANHLRHLAGS